MKKDELFLGGETSVVTPQDFPGMEPLWDMEDEGFGRMVGKVVCGGIVVLVAVAIIALPFLVRGQGKKTIRDEMKRIEKVCSEDPRSKECEYLKFLEADKRFRR